MKRRMPRTATLLRASAILALVALGLMLWPIFDPRPIAVVLAMSLGQLFGTLSFGAFLVVVVVDLIRARIFAMEARSSEPPPPPRVTSKDEP